MSTNKTGVTEDQQAEIDKAQMEIMANTMRNNTRKHYGNDSFMRTALQKILFPVLGFRQTLS
jgi:hypothetical protein